jgi:hypothetical protein
MDVLAYLREGRVPTTARAATTWWRVDDALAALPQYQGELRCRRELRGLERYVDRLPLIVTHYCRGHSDCEIAALLGGMATDYGVQTTLAAAAAFIASRVNAQLA